jgi:hypothetical protein
MSQNGQLAGDITVPESATHFQDSIRPVLVQYCADCHQGDGDEAFPFLEATTVDDLNLHRGHWKSVAEQLRNRTMPPADEDQPREDDRLRIARWIDTTLQKTACSQGPYAGSVTTRRLNRTEYDNTIRDLLELELNLSQKFPVDGSGGEGFDNNGETLFLPPLLMERYLEAATEAIDQVIITSPLNLQLAASQFQQASPDDSTVVVASDRSATAVVRIFTPNKYWLRLNVRSSAFSDLTGRLLIDGIAADTFTVKHSRSSNSSRNKADGYLVKVDFSNHLQLSRGIHALTFKCDDQQSFAIQSLELEEMRGDPTEEQRQRHKRFVGRHLGETIDQPAATALAAIRRLAEPAFRRPVEDAELTPFVALFERAFERGDSFEEALKQGMRAVLVSPHFLFRLEQPATATSPQPISDHELATRLSYFLWSTMPDRKLTYLADQGRLQQDDILTEQIDRMLADPKSAAFYYEFVGQWLGTIEVAASVIPDTGKFKGQFNTELLMDFRDEPTRLFEYIVAEDRSLLELLDADYIVVNQRLAKHYRLNGEPPPKKSNANPWSANPKRGTGGPFERFDLKDDQRGGVLGMGGVHLLTSYPTRTSPVLRGGWVLETLLGVRVPSPPPDVPELKTSQNKKKLTVKQALAMHRDHTACSACHNLMDPPGFALENYDVLGRWRDTDGSEPIDATAQLPSGETFAGPAGLRTVLMNRKDEFIRHLTARLLGYALGRSLHDRDDCTINQIAESVADSDYRARELIRQVILSTPFRQHQQAN